jgi:hypothetical protein
MHYHVARSARNPSLIRIAKRAVYNHSYYLGQPTPHFAPGGKIAESNGKTFVVIEPANGGEPIVVSVTARVAHAIHPATPVEANAVLAQLGLNVDIDLDAALDKLIELERARAIDEHACPVDEHPYPLAAQ